MNPPSEVTCGVRALRRLLAERTHALRDLDLAGFRRWLRLHLARWESDQVFVQRTKIRDLRLAHPELLALEQEHRRAVAADAASAQFPRLQRLEQELIDTGRAIAGLTAALNRAAAEKRPGLRQKLKTFRARHTALTAERVQLVRSSPERQTVLRLGGELRVVRHAVGLAREEKRLEELMADQGRRSGRVGAFFEERALELTRLVIIPDLVRKPSPSVQVLRKVTHGAARTEFDYLVVRLPRGDGQPVEVLAVVEVKRNINDLAHGFRLRQENLAWLTGQAGGYDPAVYRTKHFPTGCFDRPAVHREGSDTFLFEPASFRRFRRDPASGHVLDRLYFITRVGDLWGLSAAALARLSHRVATDEHGDLDSGADLHRLWRWCEGLADPVETPDVLRLYATTPRRGRRILLAGRDLL